MAFFFQKKGKKEKNGSIKQPNEMRILGYCAHRHNHPPKCYRALPNQATHTVERHKMCMHVAGLRDHCGLTRQYGRPYLGHQATPLEPLCLLLLFLLHQSPTTALLPPLLPSPPPLCLATKADRCPIARRSAWSPRRGGTGCGVWGGCGASGLK